jgi:hypothetical protein
VREFKVTFGGKERQLRYSSRDMKALQQQFEFAAPSDFVIRDILGIHFEKGSNTNFNLRAQHEFLAAGFRTGADKNAAAKGIVAAHVEEWWDEAIQSGLDVKVVLWTAVCAAYFAGVVILKSFDVEAESPALKRLFFAKDQDEVLAIARETEQPSSTSSTSTPTVIVAADSP